MDCLSRHGRMAHDAESGLIKLSQPQGYNLRVMLSTLAKTCTRASFKSMPKILARTSHSLAVTCAPGTKLRPFGSSETMSTETFPGPRQGHLDELPPAAPKRQTPLIDYTLPYVSSVYADVQLSGTLWLAELGKPQTVWVYYMIDNYLDVLKTAVGIGRRLGWKCSEKELALYYSPDSHFSEPLEICPIVGGQVKVINLHALNGRGRQHTRPLGVASGSKLWQLAKKDSVMKKQE